MTGFKIARQAFDEAYLALMSPEARSPKARRRGWVVVAVVLVLGVLGAGWWIGKEASPTSGESPRVSRKAPVSADEPAISSAPPSPIFDERDAPPSERAGVDASTFYKDAFALYDALSAEEKKMFSKPIEPVEEADADAAVALFEKIQPIMELLRRAAKADYCDWGLGALSFDTPLPYLSKSQNLGKVALWNAAYRFPSEAEGAIDDLSARARLGHHLSDTLIGLLVNSSFEKSAANLLRQNIFGFDDLARTKASEFLAESAVDHDVKGGLEGEIKFGRSSAEKLMAQTPDERAEAIEMMMGFGGGGDGDAEARARRERAVAVVRDPDSFRAEMEFVQKAQSQMAEGMFWPDAQFDAWMKQFDASHFAEHPIAVTTMSIYGGVRKNLQSRRIEREMLSVGMAVLESGPDVASRSRDPVTGRPFIYVANAGGFELRSAFQARGMPMTMSFDLPK